MCINMRKLNRFYNTLIFITQRLKSVSRAEHELPNEQTRNSQTRNSSRERELSRLLITVFSSLRDGREFHFGTEVIAD